MDEPSSATKGTTSTTPKRGCTPWWDRRSTRLIVSAATSQAAASTSGPPSVSTDRPWSGSLCTSSSDGPAAAASASTTANRSPSLTLITHSSTARTLARMRLGLALPQYDYAIAGQPRLPWATLAEYASRAEQLGFSSLWLADPLFLSLEKYGGSGEPSAGFEPITTLGALAAVTTEVRLGTLVVCSQLRPPAVLAK